MDLYIYKAKTVDGKENKGQIEATSSEHLKALLKEKKLYLISYKKGNLLNRDIDIGSFRKVGLKELNIFTKQFSAMIAAGLTVVNAIDIIRSQTQNKRLAQVLIKIAEDVKKGTSLSESMGNHPEVFPEFLKNMVEAGELSGNLENALNRASEHFEKENYIKGKIKGAMTYPLVVCVISIIAIAFLVAVVVPGFMSVFDQLGTELPFTTKTLLKVSGSLKNFWYLYVLITVGLGFALKAYYKSPDGHEKIDRLKLKIPIFGPINLKVAASRFSRTLATMIESGLPLLSSLEITAKVVDNYYIEKKIADVRKEVSQGAGLSEPLKSANIFPKMVTQMVAIGESTGEMEPLLKKIANFFDEEVDLAVKQLTTALEPFILVILGLIISFIVLSILQPMFSLYQSVSNL